MKPAIFSLALLLLLTGCSRRSHIPAPQAAPPPETTASVVLPQKSTVPAEPAGSSVELDDAIAIGYVTAFSPEGCTLSQISVETSGNAGVMSSAAPGSEDTVPRLEIRYLAECSFQYVYGSLSTGAHRYEDATRQDVKKQTNLYIFGTKDADGTILASRVYLYRLEA